MALSLTTQKHRGEPTHRRRLQPLKSHVISTTFCSFTKKVRGREELGWLHGPHLAPSNGGGGSLWARGGRRRREGVPLPSGKGGARSAFPVPRGTSDIRVGVRAAPAYLSGDSVS